MIYFIQAGDNGPVKIGYSNNPNTRLQNLDTGSPERLNLLAVMEGTQEQEKQLHSMFKEFNRKAEWFEPVTEIFLYINSIAPEALRSVECPMCGMKYLPNIADDVKAHTDRHALILKGALPYSVRELMKEQGWAKVREGDRVGKLAVVYAWWARARERGLPDTDSDAFLLSQLDYLDALVANEHAKKDDIDAKNKAKME